ncbi:MAG TPA: hypoxanthine-guanine phosphoribosyltransferase [Gammaproteobacteria bacterium]|nr:hypoxanthine-guanine phosphoribosyltransferase [Gammaproteobacteria bacterium]
MTVSQKHIQKVRIEADCLFSAEQVSAALNSMAEKISARHRDNHPLVLCVMNGGLIVTGELLLRLDFPLEQDYLHATRYRGKTQGGELKWLVEPRSSLKDRHVLVVDDILDEGYTLAAIVAYCQQAGARSVETVALVEKIHNRKHGIKADYIGLEVEDRYLFGYGMDYKGYLRNAAGIFAVKGM